MMIFNLLALGALYVQQATTTPITNDQSSALIGGLSPLTIERLANSCPPAGADGRSIITTWDKSQWLCQNFTNYIAGDVTGIIAYTLQDCADACATADRFVRGGCDSFTHDADLALSYQRNNGANCWLKKQRDSEGSNYDYNGSSAKLILKAT